MSKEKKIVIQVLKSLKKELKTELSRSPSLFCSEYEDGVTYGYLEAGVTYGYREAADDVELYLTEKIRKLKIEK